MVKCVPHFGQTASLFRPKSVGAIDPVGITKASASNVLNRKARMNATTTDSIVSRIADGRVGPEAVGAVRALVELSGPLAGSAGSPFAFVDVAIVFPDYRIYRMRLKSGMRI